MLPLTPENVTVVFRVVPLTKQGVIFYGTFGERLAIPEDYHHQPEAAARWYVNNGERCSWKHIAYSLDWSNETAVSDYIIPYVEPPAGLQK